MRAGQTADDYRGGGREGVRGRSRAKVTCAEENVASGGMPGHDADPLGVALQHDHGLRERSRQPVLRDLPNLSGQINTHVSTHTHKRYKLQNYGSMNYV